MEPDALGSRRAAYVRLLEAALTSAVDKLQKLEGVTHIGVFGSYARGRRDLVTDLDLLVIMDTSMGYVERLRFLYPYLSLPVDVDLLCYTPEEFRALKDQRFFRRILQEEQVLYAKEPV